RACASVWRMQEPLTDDELLELEAEVRQMSVWALDEADVRRLQLHRRSLEELRALRAEIAEARISEASLRERLQNADAQLALVRKGGRP
ncbi:MAG TPA: hypothetical protein VH083_07485, partial [Myxococcales bacterium]|nr:hypothetical protein [Myxococcales bacterium]